MTSKKSIISFLLMTMLMTSVPVAAGAEAVPAMKLDAAVKHPGDTFRITGTSPLSNIIVKIVRPDGTVLYFNAVKVNQDAYQDTITLPADTMTGQYTVIAGQGGLETAAKQTFDVTKIPSDTGGSDSSDSGRGPGAYNGGGSGSAAPTPNVGASPVKTDGSAITVTVPASALTVTEVNENGAVLAKVAVDKAALSAAFGKLTSQSNENRKALIVSIVVPGQGKSLAGAKVELPLEVLKAAQSMAPDAIVAIQSNSSSIELPVKSISVSTLESSLNALASEIGIAVVIQTKPGLFTENESKTMAAQGIATLSKPISFTISAAAVGKQVKVETSGTRFINKSLTLSGKIDPKNSTVAAIDPLTHELRFVPSVFMSAADGGTTVVLKHPTNEMYMVVSSKPTFHDAVGHWAQHSIEHLASKLIVNGIDTNTFAPDGKVTRAEFTALLVRAAGLSSDSQSSVFKDVQASDWFSGAVRTAKEQGLVSGMEDGTFRPHAEITREQMAAMLERFMGLVSTEPTDPQAKSVNRQSRFKDSGEITEWARASVELLVSNKLMDGKAADRLAPKESASRAETVVVLERLLRYAKLINE
ncbi:S-layer homology domain-containing protein [Paenibacillus puldeungensis]|uniref:S-layer homology domain-containing protein n=1 Tax=Paenibacillus puldeungensis TaxID=696536 RepID=A0ABW3S1L7_9BACL